MTAAQITALSEGILKKSRLEAEQTLFSNLYLCLGERVQDELLKLALGPCKYTISEANGRVWGCI